MNERTWYSGTPEPDRFKANDAGQALLVSLGSPGAVPAVQPVRTAQFRWQQRVQDIRVTSDLQALVDSLAQAEANDVLDLTVTGEVDLADHARLQAALGAAEARVRCLRRDSSTLRLAPTAEDIASLHADGYLGEVIQELRDESLAAADADSEPARRSQDALAILTGLLAERGSHPAGGAAA